jgi:hypothetical protein
LVGTTGFEPATPCPPDKCATKLRYAPTVLTMLSVTITKELRNGDKADHYTIISAWITEYLIQQN